jgi:proteasome lid subunit RPN8/RPN11
MLWKELEPDAKPQRLADALRGLDAFSAACAAANLSAGIRIYVTPTALRALVEHITASDTEQGGLLLGRACLADRAGPEDDPLLLLVTHSIPSWESVSSAVSLRMGSDVWCRAAAYLDEGRLVVGWYHSHPNLGAFFSGTDRSTQRAFFNQPYSLGWVIDPVQATHRLFIGADAREYDQQVVLLDRDMDLPSAG